MVVKRHEWMHMKHKIMLESINSDINELKSIQSHDYYSIQPILHVFNSHNKKHQPYLKISHMDVISTSLQQQKTLIPLNE